MHITSICDVKADHIQYVRNKTLNQRQGDVMKWSHYYRPQVDYFPIRACAKKVFYS